MSNHLKHETSPYLLQHAENPVNWYPWCEEAFQRANAEDKPVFLSIGYSTCHWCHVMAHESFEDAEIAQFLNEHFISIKVDKEERPDIDSIYMSVCQAFTGSGGWPTSIFLTPEQKPFFAGTYFPKNTRGRMVGFQELLMLIHEKWVSERNLLLHQAEVIVTQLGQRSRANGTASEQLLDSAVELFKQLYDRKHGGFGRAPKFPVPHNLLFLLTYYQRRGDTECLEMAEHTLLQMYRGGLFDHIGFGFCRYSTDERFLIPHFEKMLYDNALLILAYCKAYACTQKSLYLEIAKKTASYILKEMTTPNGGFYSAQDADSEGEEGKYYLFSPDEITALLGPKDGDAFNRRFGITEAGNFEGRNIPNLLDSPPTDSSFDPFFPRLEQYRKQRCALHLDDKILTFWNSLMIAAMCQLYRVSGEAVYLTAATTAERFIQENLYQDGTLYVSFRAGKRGEKGFLEDYAGYIFAQLVLYGATLEQPYLDRAQSLCQKVMSEFQDDAGGFFLYSAQHEALILRPKETYDGATPSGNALMAWNLVHLSQLTSEESYAHQATRQLNFLSADAAQHPAGYSMFLLTLLSHYDPPPKVTAVLSNPSNRAKLPLTVPLDTVIHLLPEATDEFPLKNGENTYYVCQEHSCLPPSNDLNALK